TLSKSIISHVSKLSERQPGTRIPRRMPGITPPWIHEIMRRCRALIPEDPPIWNEDPQKAKTAPPVPLRSKL
ncbi:hypothetical protein FRC11_002098, partial [Ceratobasidium sp. 423]